MPNTGIPSIYWMMRREEDEDISHDESVRATLLIQRADIATQMGFPNEAAGHRAHAVSHFQRALYYAPTRGTA